MQPIPEEIINLLAKNKAIVEVSHQIEKVHTGYGLIGIPTQSKTILTFYNKDFIEFLEGVIKESRAIKHHFKQYRKYEAIKRQKYEEQIKKEDPYPIQLEMDTDWESF
jgi:maltose-binding protein MalE